MGERKGQNKYYPPDYDPNRGGLNKFQGTHALRERAKKLHLGILIIRFELPYNIWCDGCQNHIGMGVRYNAEKKKVGMYYSTPLYQFRMKCHLCDSYFEIKTDPANLDYVIVSGARRQEGRWDPTENEQIAPEDKNVTRKMAADPMFQLEHGVDDKDRSKASTAKLKSLEEFQNSRWQDDYSANAALRQRMRPLRNAEKLQKATDSKLGLSGVTLLPTSEEDLKMARSLKFLHGPVSEANESGNDQSHGANQSRPTNNKKDLARRALKTAFHKSNKKVGKVSSKFSMDLGIRVKGNGRIESEVGSIKEDVGMMEGLEAEVGKINDVGMTEGLESNVGSIESEVERINRDVVTREDIRNEVRPMLMENNAMEVGIESSKMKDSDKRHHANVGSSHNTVNVESSDETVIKNSVKSSNSCTTISCNRSSTILNENVENINNINRNKIGLLHTNSLQYDTNSKESEHLCEEQRYSEQKSIHVTSSDSIAESFNDRSMDSKGQRTDVEGQNRDLKGQGRDLEGQSSDLEGPLVSRNFGESSKMGNFSIVSYDSSSPNDESE